jgi:hypothetical protein
MQLELGPHVKFERWRGACHHLPCYTRAVRTAEEAAVRRWAAGIVAGSLGDCPRVGRH